MLSSVKAPEYLFISKKKKKKKEALLKKYYGRYYWLTIMTVFFRGEKKSVSS